MIGINWLLSVVHRSSILSRVLLHQTHIRSALSVEFSIVGGNETLCFHWIQYARCFLKTEETRAHHLTSVIRNVPQCSVIFDVSFASLLLISRACPLTLVSNHRHFSPSSFDLSESGDRILFPSARRDLHSFEQSGKNASCSLS